MNAILVKIFPIFLMLIIGFLLQKSKEINTTVINGLKFLILRVSLPCILFFAFSKANLQLSYTLLFLIVFLFCILLYGIGIFLRKYLKRSYTGLFFTGFEFGMIGIALFGALYGIENISVIALLALGHEFFIWFVYFPLLESKNNGQISISKNFIRFLKSPAIVAIFIGITTNLTNTYDWFSHQAVIIGVFSAMETLSKITVPLILVVVGYSIQFTHVNWAETFKFIGLRILVVAICGFFTYQLIFFTVGEFNPLFKVGFITFVLLPPPFILPLFIKNNEDELKFFNNAILVYTLISLVLFTVLSMF